MRAVGPVLLVIGIILLVFGINSTQAIPEKAVESITGRYTRETMFYIIGGIALIVAGGGFWFFNRRGP